MSELPDSVRNITDKIDAVGNTTAAIGKGFAIGSAALTALALFATYSQVAKLDSISLLSPMVIIGLFIGAMLPFLFSAMTMNSVGKAANQMIEEVRRQFREDAGIMEGTSKPDYAMCVDISTKAPPFRSPRDALSCYSAMSSTGARIRPRERATHHESPVLQSARQP